MKKQCSHPECREWLPLSQFSKNSQTPDGLAYYCRSCNAKKQREWKQEHPEEVAAAKADYLKRQKRIKNRERDRRDRDDD